MHGIEYGIEINGGAHRSNPVWMAMQGYFDFEAAVFKLLLIIGAILLAVRIYMDVNEGRVERRERDQIEKAKEAEAEKRRLENEEVEEYYASCKQEHERKKEEEAAQEKAIPETESSSIPNSENPILKTVTPDELKRRAIEQFKKGG
jgi:predicted Holliday junction resolvase-like endonuclease